MHANLIAINAQDQEIAQLAQMDMFGLHQHHLALRILAIQVNILILLIIIAQIVVQIAKAVHHQQVAKLVMMGIMQMEELALVV